MMNKPVAVSIPPWSTRDAVYKMALKGFGDGFNPTMVDEGLRKRKVHSGCFSSFNPTMVDEGHDCLTREFRFVLGFNPTMVDEGPADDTT